MKTSLIIGSLGLLMAGSAFAADPAKGKENFQANCGICHKTDNAEKTTPPGLKGLFKRTELVNKKKVTDANVTALIKEGGNGMPPFADQLSKVERDDIIAYLKTL